MRHESPIRDNPPYWPGGVPQQVQCHPSPVSDDQLQSEIQGWLQFLEESAVTRPAGHPPDDQFELQQRRDLMLRWIAMTQQERDAYYVKSQPRKRWKPPPACFKAPAWEDDTLVTELTVNCLAPQPMSARNRAMWTKIRILLYHFDGEDGPVIDDGKAAVCIPNPALGPGSSLTTMQAFLMWRYVENANFKRMAMTSTGTVVFPSYGGRGPLLLADQQALDTGLLLLCECANNGLMEAHARVRPDEMYELWNLIDPYVLNKSIAELVTMRGGSESDGALNMEQPILDILEKCMSELRGGIDEWMDDIERYAPGYLDMEAAGNGQAPDYDCTKLRGSDELAEIPREEFDNSKA
ncbi:hypothetical protein M406DRAFT_74842 [Cryphonectria parasitica EP155]|uniref:Uncharacterized protein n=1 Tax=Cryphonectria parasitica (strain ATCC 38755 / EP155) TaxID=660469 RepID=A0A9P4XVY8_CRYP1|nr:uncharacterized protein M406DRAFT_74842 [Cryphonectria parasitica EP155]KAF3761918.1 hypothetical protein M406DRAFT_74842 [Cryphonectria parasitica EP155]